MGVAAGYRSSDRSVIDAVPQGIDCGLRAIGKAELGQDAGHVRLHGLLADVQSAGNVAIGLSVRDRVEHVELAGSEPGRVPPSENILCPMWIAVPRVVRICPTADLR